MRHNLFFLIALKPVFLVRDYSPVQRRSLLTKFAYACGIPLGQRGQRPALWPHLTPATLDKGV